jgi:hypothetical protein
MEEDHTTKVFVVSTKIFVCYEKSMKEKQCKREIISGEMSASREFPSTD